MFAVYQNTSFLIKEVLRIDTFLSLDQLARLDDVYSELLF